MVKAKYLILALSLIALLPRAALAADGQATGTVILNETCWLRQYYRFGVNCYSASAIKMDGETVLGRTGLERTRRETEKLMLQGGLDPAKADWRGHVLQPMFESFRPAPSPPPPQDWTNLGCDDSTWVLARGPFQGSRAAAITTPQLGQFDESSMDLALQQAFYRARFIVDDPTEAGELVLRVAYSGGVRAWVNGEEVARRHLPSGDLPPDAAGEDYPPAAYKEENQSLRDRSLGPVRIPQRLLRRGINVLSIEIRASRFHPVVLTNPRQVNWGGPTRPFPHARLLRLALTSDSSRIAPASHRPPGIQAWAVDLHQRVQTTDFLPLGEPPGRVHIVGARNGTYAGQIVVGTDRALASLRVTCGELRQVDGSGSLPSAVISILPMAPYPLEEWTLGRLGDERGLGASFPDARTLSADAELNDAKQACIFDRLGGDVPKTIPADTSRPVWISLRVPSDALPGAYRGTVTVSAEGMGTVTLPIELEIVNWRLPEPKNFQTWVGCEQNPYGWAKHYGAKPWSEEHFKLVEASFRQLGRIGNTWLNVPVLLNTEFGNKDDSMIRWVLKADGRWVFDFAVLDRYLDLAAKHCGPPRMVQFVVMHGMRSPLDPPAPPQVKVSDEAAAQERAFNIPSSQGEAWRAFATSLYERMKSRGWERRMYWGAPLEQEADPGLKDLLAACTPDVRWTAGPHEMISNGTYAKNDRFYSVITTIRYWPGGWPTFRSDQGWKSKTVHLLNPRVGGTVFALHTTSLPFAYRMLPQRAVSLGRNGFTRVGADEWDAVHYEGMALPKWLTGMPVLFVLWPGPAGAQSSARFECMLEGIQESEARIFLEQALDRGRLDAATAARIRQMLKGDLQETSFFQGNSIVHALEAYHYRWQERSARLYRAAAEVVSKERESR